DERDVRRKRDEVLWALDAGRLDLLLVESRDRDGDVEKRLGAATGRDGDFVEPGRLRAREYRRGAERDQHGACQRGPIEGGSRHGHLLMYREARRHLEGRQVLQKTRSPLGEKLDKDARN